MSLVGVPNSKTAPSNRAVTNVKSILSFAFAKARQFLALIKADSFCNDIESTSTGNQISKYEYGSN